MPQAADSGPRKVLLLCPESPCSAPSCCALRRTQPGALGPTITIRCAPVTPSSQSLQPSGPFTVQVNPNRSWKTRAYSGKSWSCRRPAGLQARSRHPPGAARARRTPEVSTSRAPLRSASCRRGRVRSSQGSSPFTALRARGRMVGSDGRDRIPPMYTGNQARGARGGRGKGSTRTNQPGLSSQASDPRTSASARRCLGSPTSGAGGSVGFDCSGYVNTCRPSRSTTQNCGRSRGVRFPMSRNNPAIGFSRPMLRELLMSRHLGRDIHASSVGFVGSTAWKRILFGPLPGRRFF